MSQLDVGKEVSDHVENGSIADPEKPSATVPEMPDPAAERRLVRKLDRTILPWIMLLYLLSYLDR